MALITSDIEHEVECASHVPGMDCTCPARESVERRADERAEAAAAKVRAKLAAAHPPSAEHLAAYMIGVSSTLVGEEPYMSFAKVIAAGIEYKLAGAPIVRRGDVLLTLHHELTLMIAEWKSGRQFHERVLKAAEDGPTAWMKLYDDIQMERAK